MKVRRNGQRAKVNNLVRVTEPPHVGNEVVRVINECDPVGFLSDIVNGKAIECHVVDSGGKVHTVYETPKLQRRIEAAKFLAERYHVKHTRCDHQPGKPDMRLRL